MRILIIGATGLLGRVMMQEWDSDEVAGTGSRDADIRDPDQVENLFARFHPEYTILTAAFTDVDGCENDPERAYGVNRDGAANVARAARDAGSRLIFISTDYVFDGSKNTPYEPEDQVCPICVYGRSKAEGEARVREIMPAVCIVRTSWLFGVNATGFVQTILQLARTRKEFAVVDDQTGCPTFNRDLASAIYRLVKAGAKGTVHTSNSGPCSRYDFAYELVRSAGIRDVTVQRASTSQFPRPARRPKYSVLSLKGLSNYGVSMRPWRETLPDYFLDMQVASQADKAVTQ